MQPAGLTCSFCPSPPLHCVPRPCMQLFDERWIMYLEQFVCWKSADAGEATAAASATCWCCYPACRQTHHAIERVLLGPPSPHARWLPLCCQQKSAPKSPESHLPTETSPHRLPHVQLGWRVS